VKGERQMH